MQAFILAGGMGTRLHGITNDEIPKPMAILCGKPILQWTIENLKQNGITEFYLSVGHLHEKIMEYFGDGEKFGVKIHYVIENEPLGSGGALYYVKDKMKGDFLVCSGDILFDIDLDRMMKFHKDHNALITLLYHPSQHPQDSDLVVLGNNFQVLKFDLKNLVRNYYFKNYANAGFFIIDSKALEYFTEVKKVNMEHDFINSFVGKEGRVFGYQSPEYAEDVGTIERFHDAEKAISKGIIVKKCLRNKQKALFLDRDGIIIENKENIKDASDIEIKEDVLSTLKSINRSDFLAVLIYSQKQNKDPKVIDEEFRKIETILGEKGAFFDAVCYDPEGNHSLEELINEVSDRLNIDVSSSIMIGNSDSFSKTAQKLNVPLIKIGQAFEEESSLSSAVNNILYKNDINV